MLEDELEQVKQVFISECSELLQEMESILLLVENNADVDHDVINALFRTVHTIKGTASMFAYTSVVNFTHVVEGILDQVREEKLSLTKALTSILLECRDHISQLVEEAVNGRQPEAELLKKDASLLTQLLEFSSEKIQLKEKPPDSEEKDAGSSLTEDSAGKNPYWHISLRLEKSVFGHGLDPIAFIRYLDDMGHIVNLHTITQHIPEALEMDPEKCYLGFEIAFESNKSEETIKSVFEFIEDDSSLIIIPPHSPAGAYDELIDSLPETNEYLQAIYKIMGIWVGKDLEIEPVPEANAPSDSTEMETSLTQSDSALEKPSESGSLSSVDVSDRELDKNPADKVVENLTQGLNATAVERKFLKVEASKLDNLINLVGELVVAGANISQIASKRNDADLNLASTFVSSLIAEIRENTLGIRMVPVGDTFNRFRRVVREISNALGKNVNLRITGGDTELDKTMIEKIGDPLMHIIRNAIDHGLEEPAERSVSGKAEAGTLKLNAFHEHGSIVLEISDDGRGLDKERIKEKALERGLIGKSNIYTDQEIYNLIFEPGFSTAAEVTNLSGRGVGMDVVRRNIEAVRGQVSVESEPGQGARVSLRLPLTLAIIDGFLVKVNQAYFIVPLDMVLECIDMSSKKEEQELQGYINLRGEVLPYVRLSKLFWPNEINRSETGSIVVVQYGSVKGGLLVDELEGEHQTVIKPLGQVFQKLKGISGMSILGSGEISMVLDVAALMQLATSREERRLTGKAEK